LQRKIRTVFMRGGTSRALFFHDKDLPSDPEVRARVILAAYDSPDSYGRQIDGRGVLLPHLRKYSYGASLPQKKGTHGRLSLGGQFCIGTHSRAPLFRRCSAARHDH